MIYTPSSLSGPFRNDALPPDRLPALSAIARLASANLALSALPFFLSHLHLAPANRDLPFTIWYGCSTFEWAAPLMRSAGTAFLPLLPGLSGCHAGAASAHHSSQGTSPSISWRNPSLLVVTLRDARSTSEKLV